MIIKVIDIDSVEYGNLGYDSNNRYGLGELNRKLTGAVKVDVFVTSHGCRFIAQWPDETTKNDN